MNAEPPATMECANANKGFYIGLVHYPVYNKRQERICSAVTTVDLHDLARLAATYGAESFFVITPLAEQRALVERVRRHWTDGYGARYNACRKQAFKKMRVVATLQDAVSTISESQGRSPFCIATDASQHGKVCLSYSQARRVMEQERPVLLLFGTAWGLAEDVLEKSDCLLEPVCGPTCYNHLSVRTAAAIVIDRLAAPLWRNQPCPAVSESEHESALHQEDT